MGEAKRRRQREDQAERYVSDPKNRIAYQVRAARMTPRQLIAELTRVAAAARDDTNVEVNVPCKGCVQCCYWPRVEVEPENESPEHLQHLAVAQDERGWHLQKRADGACVHLGPAGCTVRSHRPRACRVFDCRLAGLGESLLPIAEWHYAPFWFFRLDDDRDKAVMMAAKIGMIQLIARLHKGDDPPGFGELIAAMMAGVREHLQLARDLVEYVRQLPEAERAKFAADVDAAQALLRERSLEALAARRAR